MNPPPNVVFQIEATLTPNADKIDDANDTPTLGTTGSYTDGDEESSTLSNPTASTDLPTALKSTWLRPDINFGRTGESCVHQASQSIKPWCGTKYFSHLVKDGLDYLNWNNDKVVMVYECPSSSCNDTSFYNANQYKIHDYPPTPFEYKAFLRPLRYSSMNGNAYPSYLMDEPDPHLLSHWIQTIPNFVCPEFVCTIPPTSKIYAYLPTENLPNHVHDPDVHYELAGKRAINLMTDHAPRLLPNTKDIRPCVTKVTHGMGSLGVFVIANDEDEAEFEQFVQDTGKPTYVITEFVNIQRNLSCHFFIHPNGDLIWFGSSENLMLSSGKWSSDSTIDMDQQKYLEDLQAPYAGEVADYCRSSGYWGFCGIDVLINTEGVGFVVDVNPRVTGTMPALMVASQIQSKFGYRIGKFRKSSKCIFPGSAEELFHKVDEYNADHQGNSIVVVFSIHEMKGNMTRINVGAFGYTHEVCESLLDCFAPFVDV